MAFLGAGGMMGFALARNIARAGISVRAWNRTRDKAEPLAGDGAHIAGTPAAAAAGAGIVATMLSDGDAVLAAMDGDDGALAVMADSRPPAVWLQMSTIGQEATESCASLAGRHGVLFVDAPVLGTLFDLLARRLGQAAAEHGDEDISASYLISAPEHACVSPPL